LLTIYQQNPFPFTMRYGVVFRAQPCHSPGMTTHFQKLLRDQADSPLFSGQGDGIKDGRYYLINGFDGFLASAAKAIAADGVDRQTHSLASGFHSV